MASACSNEKIPPLVTTDEEVDLAIHARRISDGQASKQPRLAAGKRRSGADPERGRRLAATASALLPGADMACASPWTAAQMASAFRI
jgi:hypothetical protein